MIEGISTKKNGQSDNAFVAIWLAWFVQQTEALEILVPATATRKDNAKYRKTQDNQQWLVNHWCLRVLFFTKPTR